MNFALERFTPDLLGEMWPLLTAHHKEVPNFSDIEPDPDAMYYDTLQNIGSLRVFTARENGALLGYAVFVVYKHPQYQTCLQAKLELIYLSKRGEGHKFIKWCDKQLEEERVQIIHFSVSSKLDYSPILKRMKYQKMDTTYSRKVF